MSVSVLPPRHERGRSRGQSLVEFALVAPVLLLILLVGIDAGRLFFGWVNLQNTARIGANFAGIHPTAWNVPGSASDRARYETQIQNDATVINCTLPNPLPTPAFPDGKELGDLVVVGLDCEFDALTPFVSAILGDPVMLSSSAEFPIRTGIVAGGTTVPPPGPIPTPTPGATPTPPPPGTCTVPDFVASGTKKNSAAGAWTGAGFTGGIAYSPNPSGNWTITSQSLPAGAAPCTSAITVGG